MPPTNQQPPEPMQRQDGYAQPSASGAMPPGYSPAAPPPLAGASDYEAASQLKKHHGRLWLILFIVMLLLFIGAVSFGVWAFMERNEYKNETDAIVEREVAAAVEANAVEIEAEFLEREKEPLTNYTSPGTFGSLSIDYPKTWSAYVDEHAGSSTPLEGFFHPGFVPNVDGQETVALRVELSSRSYERELSRFNAALRREDVRITPIEAENVEGVIGSRVDGEIQRDTQGSVVLFELRDKTLILTTESTAFLDDFDNIILANLDFTP